MELHRNVMNDQVLGFRWDKPDDGYRRMREIIVQHVVIWDLRLKVSPHRRRNVMEHFEMSIIRDICRAMSETQDHMRLPFFARSPGW